MSPVGIDHLLIDAEQHFQVSIQDNSVTINVDDDGSSSPVGKVYIPLRERIQDKETKSKTNRKQPRKVNKKLITNYSKQLTELASQKDTQFIKVNDSGNLAEIQGKHPATRKQSSIELSVHQKAKQYIQKDEGNIIFLTPSKTNQRKFAKCAPGTMKLVMKFGKEKEQARVMQKCISL